MFSRNPNLDHANNARSINASQQNIGELEERYQASILGDSLDQDKLRDELSRIRAFLGELRLRASEIIKEQLNEQEARKDKGLTQLALG